MPMKSEKIKLKEEQDRRRKLSTVQKQEIKELYSTGKYSLRKLALRFGVSKKTILLIVNPESLKKQKEYTKQNWKQWQRHGDEWNKIQREHRKYKQNLYNKGELKED